MDTLELVKQLIGNDEVLRRLMVDGFYRPLYIICNKSQGYNQDIAGAIEYTLHVLLDNNFSDDQIFEIIGANKSTIEDMKAYESEEEYYYIDLDYIIPGTLLDIQIPANI